MDGKINEELKARLVVNIQLNQRKSHKAPQQKPVLTDAAVEAAAIKREQRLQLCHYLQLGKLEATAI